MKTNVSLPYPVLSTGDDILPSLDRNSILVTQTHDHKNYSFKIELLLENDDILKYIEEGKAEYTCEVTCAKTYLRRCYHSTEPSITFEIGRKEVIGDIYFRCYVTVKEDILDYHNSQFNEDYEDALFDMEPGDVLAAFPLCTYTAHLKYDKLYSAGSFMVVQEDKNGSSVWFDATGDKILVYLPTPMFEQFQSFSNNQDFNELFHASIVFNALFKCISEYNPETQENCLWASAIRYRINTEDNLKDFKLEDKVRSYELAQALLQDPYRRMFQKLNEQQQSLENKN